VQYIDEGFYLFPALLSSEGAAVKVSVPPAYGTRSFLTMGNPRQMRKVELASGASKRKIVWQ